MSSYTEWAGIVYPTTAIRDRTAVAAYLTANGLNSPRVVSEMFEASDDYKLACDFLTDWLDEGRDPQELSREEIVLILADLRADRAWLLEHIDQRCLACGADVDEAGGVPAEDDDTAWRRLAAAHWLGCEWVATRAYRIPAG